jgi:ribose/xylose/arabinose/galactoside ABC-type transport system permease subunit
MITDASRTERKALRQGSRFLASGGTYLGLILVLLIAAFVSPAFYQPDNLFNILRQASALGILALAQAVVMIGAGVDLSVAATMQLAVVAMAEFTQGRDARVPVAILICAVLGALVGWINGIVITKRRVPAFLVTLGVSIAVTGARLAYTQASPSGLLPPVIRVVGGGKLGPVPIATLVFAALGLLVALILNGSTFGRRLYATGANREAARLSGVPVDPISILTYVISGLLSVLAGLVLAGYVGYADQWIGRGMELDSIAAVVVGGGSFAGGIGNVSGTVAGVLLVTVLLNLVLLLNLDVQYQLLVKGVVIIVAVALYSTRGKK